ncbi:MAG TPA: hypothetical protein VJ810_01445 [Blastocatellia bacterium]|nr:hypothetical protein [Blastocatellia bacterium]
MNDLIFQATPDLLNPDPSIQKNVIKLKSPSPVIGNKLNPYSSSCADPVPLLNPPTMCASNAAAKSHVAAAALLLL